LNFIVQKFSLFSVKPHKRKSGQVINKVLSIVLLLFHV